MQYAQKLPALFQHTAARRRLVAGQRQAIQDQIGFNTQPPEGGWCFRRLQYLKPRLFQHTAARRRLDNELGMPIPKSQFQHTAARRRLGPIDEALLDSLLVSTHSRPKAAGKVQRHFIACAQFQHTAARRRLAGLQEVGHD